MPDLTIVSMQQCKQLSESHATVGGYDQWGLGSEREWPSCSCLAYKYHKNGTTNFGGMKVPEFCKHIIQAQKERCSWHQMWGSAQSEQQKEAMTCPECGGETEWVGVGV